MIVSSTFRGFGRSRDEGIVRGGSEIEASTMLVPDASDDRTRARVDVTTAAPQPTPTAVPDEPLIGSKDTEYMNKVQVAAAAAQAAQEEADSGAKKKKIIIYAALGGGLLLLLGGALLIKPKAPAQAAVAGYRRRR